MDKLDESTGTSPALFLLPKGRLTDFEAGEIVALATIVRAQGSTPRATGAKMLVFRDGTIKGTIGGGEMERCVIEEARAALESGQPRTSA